MASTFTSTIPSTGQPGPTFHAATPAEVDLACRAAAEAFRVGLGRAARADFLERAADGLASLGDRLLEQASLETGLPAMPRLAAERDRTVNQLRMFAGVVREGSWVEAILQVGNARRTPVPTNDLRRMLIPLGPVAVYGASNFPLAYSVAGGDTASALAAGCPVVVKGHPSHPGTGAMVAEVMRSTAETSGLPAGTFSYLPAGGDRDLAIAHELISHPAIRAAGFTGSPSGGMALARLAADRPNPIPVYAEMGSVNPVVALESAGEAKGVAEKLAASAVASAGQMCTCPGLVFAVRGTWFENLASAMSAAISATPSVVMLNPRIRAAYTERLASHLASDGVRVLAGDANPNSPSGPLVARPALLRVASASFRRNASLAEECFGPAVMLVECDDTADVHASLERIHGSLTGTLWCGTGDPDAPAVMALLAARCGRVIVNGVPTGVEVCAPMVHGGPFPACNRPESTAVGPLAIRRWCRPVCFQNVPESLLPEELHERNPLEIERLVDGVRSR